MFQRKSSELLFNFRFSSRKSQTQQKLAKKISHFTIQFRSKNVTDPTNLDSIGIENNMFSQYSQKSFWHYKFSSKDASAWYQRKHLHCIISWRSRTAFLKYFESKCLHISVYLRNNFFFQRRSNILSDESGLLGRGAGCVGWIISWRRLVVWVSKNVLQFFILIKSFENSTIF